MTYIVLKAPLNSNQPTNQSRRNGVDSLLQMSHVAWSVCLCGCWAHGELCNAKTGEPIEMSFRRLTQVGPRNNGGQDPTNPTN